MLVLRVELRQQKLINKELPLPSQHPGEIQGLLVASEHLPFTSSPPTAEELLGDWREQLH